MVTVSAASLMLVDHSSHHRNNLLRKYCAVITAVELSISLKKTDRMTTEKEKMVLYEQFGLVNPAFRGYKNVISDVPGLKRGKRIVAHVSHTGERRAVRKLRSKQKAYFFLRELLSRFSQHGDLLLDRFAGMF